MGKIMVIGAGGVGNVVVRKCAGQRDVFSAIMLASRTRSKCDAIAAAAPGAIDTAEIDADDGQALTQLIREFQPALVINVALPYQDLHIMEACLAGGAHYLDTANYEPPEEARFEYRWQWEYDERFRTAGLMALLGSGFDPGVTNIFCAYAQQTLFDEIETIDILDCNAGDHGHPFATNFNPEINIREVTQRGKYWQDGAWHEVDPLSISCTFDFPGVGPRRAYLLYHEEEESLVRYIRGLKRIRFWMTFGEEYLTHLRVLRNVGLTRIDPVVYQGRPIVPIQFLKALLPDPSSLAAGYTGKTSIGCLIEGRKDGARKTCFIHNVCDHAACHAEVGAQAVSYTTGVPAMVGAMMMLQGTWMKPGVWNVEQFPAAPFLEALGRHGLPWSVTWHEADAASLLADCAVKPSPLEG